MYPNKCVKPKIFQPTLLPPLMYSGEISHHMHDSGESVGSSCCHTINTTSPSICQLPESSVCHTINMASPSICQSQHSSVCHTIYMTSLSICQSHNSSVCHTINMTSSIVCQSHNLSVCHTIIMTSLSVCQSNDSSVSHTIITTSPSICQLFTCLSVNQNMIPPGTLSVSQYVHYQFCLAHQLNSW